MKKSILVICEDIQSELIREQNRVKDGIMKYQKQFCCVGHIARFKDDRSACVIVKWNPRHVNEQLEDFHDTRKMKLSNDSDQYGDKQQKQVQN